MRYVYVCLASMAVILAGCPPNSGQPPSKAGPAIPIPDAKLVGQLPTFAKQENEVEIADTMNDVDPSWVLGSIVDIKTGKVRGLDNYLSGKAKPSATLQTEVVFKDLIENSVAMNAAWLEFLRAQLNDKVRAELSVIKTSKVTMKNEDVDKEKLTSEMRKIPRQERSDYGVVIGYVDFVLSASLFKDFGTEASTSGYGAKIGGTWFTKFENTSAHHRVVAIWSPLPFVVDYVSKPAPAAIDLESATGRAIREGTVDIKRVGRPVAFDTYLKNRM